MTIISDVMKELFAMFVADYRLTAGTLALIAAVAVLIAWIPDLDPLIPGSILLIGCLAIIAFVTTANARNSRYPIVSPVPHGDPKSFR